MSRPPPPATAPSAMIVRFDTRPDPQGWTIFDRMTDEPVVVDGVSAVGLSYEDADELADRLNTLQVLKGGTPLH